VNTYAANDQLEPSVTADSSGNFVVAWSSHTQDGSSLGIFGQRYTGSGAPLGPEFRVNTYTSGVQRHPSVASDSSGNFVVAWSGYAQESGTVDGVVESGIFGQRYGEIVPVELMGFGVE
jgi:hypothetical protein